MRGKAVIALAGLLVIVAIVGGVVGGTVHRTVLVAPAVSVARVVSATVTASGVIPFGSSLAAPSSTSASLSSR
ncbi:hypothetical protein F5887DRAFT_981839 [Amanita rubescens]|nr:hypothetical protein F5887DRAFT_981839 [Amanita rubescens]